MKVAMFEKLKQGMFEKIIVNVCDFLINDCDTCPKFISSRCKESCNEMRLRRLRTEEKIMTNIEKLKQGMFDDMNDEANAPEDAPIDAPKDAPKGWIKLKAKGDDIYINVSKIVGISLPLPPYVSNKPLTAIYTVDTEKVPWIVDESIDEVMKKIEKA